MGFCAGVAAKYFAGACCASAQLQDKRINRGFIPQIGRAHRLFLSWCFFTKLWPFRFVYFCALFLSCFSILLFAVFVFPFVLPFSCFAFSVLSFVLPFLPCFFRLASFCLAFSVLLSSCFLSCWLRVVFSVFASLLELRCFCVCSFRVACYVLFLFRLASSCSSLRPTAGTTSLFPLPWSPNGNVHRLPS